VARGDRRHDDRKAEGQRDAAEHPLGAPVRAGHPPQDDRKAERQHRPREREPPEPRLHHRRHRVPRGGLAQREIARRGGLEHDARQRHDGEQEGDDGEPALHAMAHVAGGGHQHQHERRDSPDADQHQGVVEEAPARVDRGHHERRVLEHLRGHALRLRPGCLDVEDERAFDRVRVGGDHLPRHRVGSALQPAVDRHRDAVARRPGDLAGVHLAALSVVHAQGAERALDRLVELQHDAVRRILEDRVVGRLCLQ
jgi:hypothetical protein